MGAASPGLGPDSQSPTRSPCLCHTSGEPQLHSLPEAQGCSGLPFCTGSHGPPAPGSHALDPSFSSWPHPSSLLSKHRQIPSHQGRRGCRTRPPCLRLAPTLLSLKRSPSWVAGMILRVMEPWDWAWWRARWACCLPVPPGSPSALPGLGAVLGGNQECLPCSRTSRRRDPRTCHPQPAGPEPALSHGCSLGQVAAPLGSLQMCGPSPSPEVGIRTQPHHGETAPSHSRNLGDEKAARRQEVL